MQVSEEERVSKVLQGVTRRIKQLGAQGKVRARGRAWSTDPEGRRGQLPGLMPSIQDIWRSLRPIVRSVPVHAYAYAGKPFRR